ncbi:MAG TPA: WD40 repeat domain-containing protein, partial [Anaerolineales bacterium]|nr:WD40 repeat domain-containing protein [Anaerolineales bacterium]
NRNALSLSFTPDGHHLAIGMEEGTILLWDLSLLDENTNAESTLEAACSQVTRPFTDAEWQQYIGALPQTITCPNLRQ